MLKQLLGQTKPSLGYKIKLGPHAEQHGGPPAEERRRTDCHKHIQVSKH